MSSDDKAQYLIQEFPDVIRANIWLDMKANGEHRGLRKWTPVSISVSPVNGSVLVLVTRAYS